jgi:endonuclease YncB( thermonuclease family)
MIKKIMMLLVVIFSLTTIASCTTPVEEDIILPDLTGMNEEQAIAALSAFKLIVSTSTIINNNVREGRFLNYGNDYKTGDLVDPYTSIIVYFAVHANLLPDLTGMNTTQLLTELAKINVIVEMKTRITNTVAAGLFVDYGNNLDIGDILEDGTEVIVYIAEPLVSVNRGLMISKYLEGSLYNRSIELYNTSEETIDLSLYHLSLYLDGSSTVNYTIDLSGMLEPGETFTVSYSSSDSTILEKSDLLSNALLFNGNDTITLNYDNNAVVDIIGTIGWGLFYLDDQTLVRKPNIASPNTIFSIGEWDSYTKDYITIFGAHPVTYPTTFTFDSKFLALPFTEPGGMIEVDYDSIYDGDTAYFTPGFLGENRVRFIGIDTPEMGSGLLATQARDYARNRLSSATTIYLQHEPTSGNVDTYGRYLALIWVDGALLNYEMVLNGYSQNNYQDSTMALVFNGIPLSRWMTNAENFAKSHNLGVWA